MAAGVSGNTRLPFPFPKFGNEFFIPIPVPKSWEWNSSFPFPIVGNASHPGTLCGSVLDVSRPVSAVPKAHREPKNATKTKKITRHFFRLASRGPKNGRNGPFRAINEKTESPPATALQFPSFNTLQFPDWFINNPASPKIRFHPPTSSYIHWAGATKFKFKLVGADFYAFRNYALVASIKHCTVRCWYLEIFVAFEKMVWRNHKKAVRKETAMQRCQLWSELVQLISQRWQNLFGNVVPEQRTLLSETNFDNSSFSSEFHLSNTFFRSFASFKNCQIFVVKLKSKISRMANFHIRLSSNWGELEFLD